MDLSGHFVIRGLIDAHVHLSFGPGSGLRDPNPASWGRHIDQYLNAYLASGVTTVLDAGSSLDAIANIKSG